MSPAIVGGIAVITGYICCGDKDTGRHDIELRTVTAIPVLFVGGMKVLPFAIRTHGPHGDDFLITARVADTNA